MMDISKMPNFSVRLVGEDTYLSKVSLLDSPWVQLGEYV